MAKLVLSLCQGPRALASFLSAKDTLSRVGLGVFQAVDNVAKSAGLACGMAAFLQHLRLQRLFVSLTVSTMRRWWQPCARQ